MRGVLLLLCLLLASAVEAGPWPRGKGHWFVAANSTWATGDAGQGLSSSLYAEYGLGRRLTLVLDGTQSEGQFSGVAYLRYPLWHSEAGHRLAMELGMGQQSGQAVARGGISYGRGLVTRWGNGWVTVDTVSQMSLVTGLTSYKADVTLGVSPSDRWKAIMQLQTGLSEHGRFHAKLAPSVVRQFGYHLWGEIGLIHAIHGPQETGVKLGFWIEF